MKVDESEKDFFVASLCDSLAKMSPEKFKEKTRSLKEIADERSEKK
jgi:hypothetical protein